MGGMSVGEGLWALGQGLQKLDDDLRERARNKIDIILQQVGGDWTAAAPVIQGDPNLQRAFRKAYGIDFNPSTIQKSVEQQIKELKRDDMQRGYNWEGAAYNQAIGESDPLTALRVTDPNTANVWLSQRDRGRLTDEQLTQGAQLRAGLTPKIAQYIDMIKNYQMATGRIAPREYYEGANFPYPGEAQPAPAMENPAMSFAANMMQLNPMTAGMGQATGTGLESLTQAAQNVFGGGAQEPEPYMKGTTAYANTIRERNVGSQIQRREDQTQADKDRMDIQRGFLKVAQDRLNEYKTHRGKQYGEIIGSGKLTAEQRASLAYVQKRYDRDIRMADMASSTIQKELDKHLEEERRYRLMGKMDEWEAKKVDLESRRDQLEKAVEDLRRQEDNEVSTYLPSLKKTSPTSEKKSVFDPNKW